ncbi:PCDH9 isoform 5, partial [Pongo abelii]
CNSHSKSDNIPVTPQKCPSSASFHIQENEESHYEDTLPYLRYSL